MSDEVVFENVSNSGQSLKVEGRAAFAELAQQSVAMFSARNQRVRKAVVAANEVALEIDWTGTPAVDLGSVKAGIEITMRGASFFTMADGKITHLIDLS